MALVNKRKLVILATAVVSTAVLVSLFTSGSKKSSSDNAPKDQGAVEIEVSPTQAMPLTVFDESIGKEIARLYSFPAKFNYTTGSHTFTLKSYDYEDFKIEVDIIAGTTVTKKVSMVSKNLTPDYSELGTTITTNNGEVVQNVQYYEYASWASGVLESGNKAVLQSVEDFWTIVYSGSVFNRDEMLRAEIPETVINSVLGSAQ